MKRAYVFVALLFLTSASTALAYQVYGAIGDKWRQLGAERGPLGPPISDELDAARGGRHSDFQNGFIYYYPSTGAHAVYGPIGKKWDQLGRERGFGYPLTDDAPAKAGGRFNDFENGGSIYSHPTYGVHAVYGSIRAKWHALGREAGVLGYPVTDEMAAANGGRFNNFQFGMIYWHPKVGAYAVYGRIGEKWIALSRESGVCGYPTSDEYDFDDQRDTGEYTGGISDVVSGHGSGKRFRRSDFAGGYILWSKGKNQVSAYCGKSSPSKPDPPPPSEACRISVTIRNKACLNPDGSSATNLDSGQLYGTGCGASVENARARAKQSYQQWWGCLTGGDQPSLGCCTYSEEVIAGCLCP